MPFDSMEAREINRKIFENIYFVTFIESSMEIARKRKKFVQEYKRIYNQQVKNVDYKFTDEESSRMTELENEHFITQEELRLPGQYAGAYSSFIGSPIYEGQPQYDMWGVEPSSDMAEEWSRLKADIKKHGVRNSLLTGSNANCFYKSNSIKQRMF